MSLLSVVKTFFAVPTSVRAWNDFWKVFRLEGLYTGTGDPDGVVTAPVGSLFLRSDGGAGTTLYVKESGTGDTGWVAK